MFDVTIIGAGVVGCSIARELSKYSLKICVLEKASDVASGATRANSAIVHAGYDAKPGTLKAKLNALGNPMFDELSRELDFPFKRTGSLVICFNREELKELERLLDQGVKNGIPGLRIIYKEELLRLEPNLSEDVYAGLYAETAGIVCPYEMTIALAENASQNGAEFRLNTGVTNLVKGEDYFTIETENEIIQSRLVINAAGVYADDINNMVSQNKITILPRRGEYCVFDKSAGDMVKITVFQVPTVLGKGILVTPTVDGNLLMGPNAVDVSDKEDLSTTREGLEEVLRAAKKSIKEVPRDKIISSFAGLRARPSTGDFIIGEATDVKNFINAAGIESPGLTSAPAIGKMVEEIVVNILRPAPNKSFNPKREGIKRFRELDNDERRKLIEENPAWGRVVCRCETVTEGEVIEAIKRPVGARTLDGVKRRTRCGMGRCQSGFCSTRIVDILSRELQVPVTEITKFGGESKILCCKNKEGIE